MHREKRQNRITEQRKIQKEICRILLIFTMILSMICVVNLTGCRDRKSQEQTELISLDGREPDVEKADGNTEKESIRPYLAEHSQIRRNKRKSTRRR